MLAWSEVSAILQAITSLRGCIWWFSARACFSSVSTDHAFMRMSLHRHDLLLFSGSDLLPASTSPLASLAWPGWRSKGWSAPQSLRAPHSTTVAEGKNESGID
jgi:hypothetical protein